MQVIVPRTMAVAHAPVGVAACGQRPGQRSVPNAQSSGRVHRPFLLVMVLHSLKFRLVVFLM